METKQCRQCGTIKPRSEFYRHPMASDGLQYRCKACAKAYDAALRKKRLADPQLREADKQRWRDSRLGRQRQFNDRHKADPVFRQILRARAVAWKHMPKAPSGMVRHHWSYGEAHMTDVIFLKPAIHRALHRYMQYDGDAHFFRTRRGHLLDTKRKHVRWMLAVLRTLVSR